MHNTPQFIFPFSGKMTDVTVQFIDGIGFSMGGCTLVAPHTIFSAIYLGKILLWVGCDLNRDEPGKISDCTAFCWVTGPTGLLKSIWMHRGMRVVLGSDIMPSMTVETLGAVVECPDPVPVLLIMTPIAAHSPGPHRFLMSIIQHICVALLAGCLTPVDRAIELIRRHLER